MLKSILLASAIALAIVGNANAADPWTNEETSAGVKKLEYTRYAFAGRKINLQFMGTLNADCTQPEEYEASIITEPKHGVAELEPRTDFMNYAKDNPRAKCNETKYFSLTKEPEHGTVDFVPYIGFATYAKDNVRAKCNDKKLEGHMLSYKTKDGYVGMDSFTFLEFSLQEWVAKSRFT